MARTAGEQLSWLALGVAAAFVALQPVACTTDDPGADDVSADILAVLADVGPQVVLPTLQRFDDSLATLRAASVDWSIALEGGADGVAEREVAQQAWRETMSVWQEVEVMQIGPAGSSLTAVAGADLRDEMYSWPTVNPCRVDQETAQGEWDGGDFFSANLVNSYGLDALEHLLWAPDDGNACPAQVPPNEDGSWVTLGTQGVLASRAAFAVALCDGLATHSSALQQEWDGAFGDAFAAGESPYDGGMSGLNAVFDALFYLEIRTKDRKLAFPLGLKECVDFSCEQGPELSPSGASIMAIQGNIVGFERLFNGGNGEGMDDLLRTRGHGDLADQINGAISGASAAAAEVDGSLDDALVDDADDVAALYDALATLTTLVKGELAATLTLVIPTEAAGDAD